MSERGRAVPRDGGGAATQARQPQTHGGAYAVAAARRHGAETMFTLSGGHVFPLYDAGNFGMQRRRVHGVIADPGYDPRAIMDNEFIPFTKEMEGIGTVPGPVR